MAGFFKRLSYSIGNEDWKTEQKALAIRQGDTIFTVTASGDRPLNLLFSPCEKIISVDANPFQTALCDLKKAAIQELDYDEYLAFLGLKAHSSRLGILRKLESKMLPQSVKCWRENDSKIRNGISYQGQVEKLCRKASKVIRALEGKKVDTLFSFNTVEEQKEFVEKNWNWKTWKAVVDVCLHPLFTRFFLKDPGLYKHVDSAIRPSTYMYSRIEMALKTLPVRENLILSLVLQGKIFEDGFSPHLSENECKEIRKHLHKLSVTTNDVFSYLKDAPDSSLDCISLSDIASYMPREAFDTLCKEIVRVAKPGSRFCIRQWMSSYDFANDLKANFHRNHALEKELESEDRCFVYRFMVGTINK